MTPLIICSIIAFVGIIFIVLAFTSDEKYGFIAGLILFLDIFLGFGLFCSTKTESSTETQVEFSYAKSKSTVIIETTDKTETFTDAYTFNSISDSSRIYLHADYNAYGSKVGSYLIIK